MCSAAEKQSDGVDGDELIATYSVYASSLAHLQLHIFQFPLRCRSRPYEASEVRLFVTDGLPLEGEDLQGTTCVQTATADHKPGPSTAPVIRPSSRITMRCVVDTFGSSSFETTEQDKTLCHGSQHQGALPKHTYHYALQSHPFQPRCDYAVALIVDGALHIAPVGSIQQFTPIVMPGKADSAHRVNTKSVSVPSMPIVPGLTISDRVNREMLRQRSVMFNADADTAREVQHFPIHSVESMAVRRRLWATPSCAALPYTQCAGVKGNLDANRGVSNGIAGERIFESAKIDDSFFPPELLVSGGITGGVDSVGCDNMLRRYASKRGIAQQVSAFLRRCQVFTFSELRKLVVIPEGSSNGSPSTAVGISLRGDVASEPILNALREGAVWMHGVWVAKLSPHFTGNAAALREVVLLHFFQSSDAALSRAQLNGLVSSNALRRTVKEILESIATLNSDEPNPTRRVWRLRHVPADVEGRKLLLKSANEVYAQEIVFQRMQCEKLCTHMAAHLAAINSGVPVPRLLFTQQGESVGLPMNVTSAAAAAAAAQTAAATAANFTDAELAPIVAHIRRLFLEHGVLNKQRAKELVMRGKQQYFPEATNQMLSISLQRSVQPFTNATWVLKKLGEPEVDKYRPLILETALELANFETRAFNTLFEEKRQKQLMSTNEGATATGEGGSCEDLQKITSRVLAEVAVYKQYERLWHLKSGNAVNE
ncbi:hypothetical protein TRVL_00501 [Trypanosoma vivax]|nr:hypothetical protein TRVL_00501 [Trypanosoma vivax]